MPLGGVCSLWSALGAAAADLLHIHETVDILANPFEPARVNAVFAQLEEQGVAQLREDAVDLTTARIQRSADIRYKGQINEVEVGVPDGPLDAAALEGLVAAFHARYESLYGPGRRLPRGAGGDRDLPRADVSREPKAPPPASTRAGPDAAIRRVRAVPARVLGGNG